MRGVAAVIVALAAGLTWALWPFGDNPRAREYREATACLLTPAGGLSNPEVAPVWAALQDVSLATRAKVQYLEIDGPQTPDNARGYVSSLAQNRCDVVLTVGTAASGAVASTAAAYPNLRFLVVGAAVGDVPDNVAVLSEPSRDALQRRVRDAVTDAVGK